MFNDIFGPKLVLFFFFSFYYFIWKARIGIEDTEKGHSKENRAVVLWVPKRTTQNTLLLLDRLLIFSFSLLFYSSPPSLISCSKCSHAFWGSEGSGAFILLWFVFN